MGGVLGVLIFIAASVGAAVSIDRIRVVYEREGFHFWERWENWGRWRDPRAWAASAEIFTWSLVLALCGIVIAAGIIRQL